MNDKEHMRREILLWKYQYPSATHKEIAQHVGCPASSVSKTISEFNDVGKIESLFDGSRQSARQLFEGIY